MNTSLIFGRDPTERIVNMTLKNDIMQLYMESTDGAIKCDEFPYTPFVLTHDKANERSERLQGDQHFKWLTSTSCEKYNELNKSFQRNLWMPRSIEESYSFAEGATLFKGMKVEDVSILSFDIETSGLVMNGTSKVFCISNTFRKQGKVTRRLFSIDDYDHQITMILDWIDWVLEVNPSVMCGHNIFSYDLPYLDHCVKTTGYKGLELGRDASLLEFSEKVSKFRKDGSQAYEYHNARITGREIIDTFFLSMKYDQVAREFPSYGLKPIVKHLGLEKEGRTLIDPSKIAEEWKDPVKRELIKKYAEEDSDDALKLFDLMIPASFYLCQSVPMSLQNIVNTASGSQINNWMIRSYLQDGHSIPQADRITEHLAGGISFGVPGLYKNMAKIDLKSAYPSQILRFKLYDKNKDPKGHFYEMIKYYTEERFDLKDQYKKIKNQYFKDREQAAKVMINSGYGALSTNYLNYNSPDLAAKITYETREVIDLALRWASSKGKDYWIELFKERTGA